MVVDSPAASKRCFELGAKSLALDRVLPFEVVLPDGTRRHRTAEEVPPAREASVGGGNVWAKRGKGGRKGAHRSATAP